MTGSARLGVVVVALALASAGGVADARASGAEGPRPSACSARPPPVDPIETAVRFLTLAVQRRDLAGSYRLTTPSLRDGLTCRQWIAGRIPVQAFRSIDWRRSAYRAVARGDRQIVLRVVLFDRGRTPKFAKAFLMELRQGDRERGDGWRVGFWERVPLARGDLLHAQPR